MTLSNPFTHDPRVLNEAKSLMEQGHEVTVLAWDRNKENKKVEEKDGIRIVRFQNTKFMDLLHYDIFRLRYWWKNGYKLALELHKEQEFDVIHSHDLDTLPIGIKLKKKVGIPLIYDAHEIWGYMVEKGVPWWRYYLWKERRLLNHVDHMIVTNSARKEFYENKTSAPIWIVDNYKKLFSEEYIEPPNHMEKKLKVLYIGGFIPKRFLPQLIEVVGETKNVFLEIGGRGELYDKIKRKSQQSESVEFIGTVPPGEVIPRTVKSDVVFCMIAPNDKNDVTATTNKQYEAMVSGRPIICSKGTISGKITEKENCGLAIDYSKKSLKNALKKLRENPELRKKLGSNALNAAKKKYNWKTNKETLKNIYEEVRNLQD